MAVLSASDARLAPRLRPRRLSDFRRLIRDGGRSPESVFPSGEYPLGGTHGTDVNFPIPQTDEFSTPNVTNSSMFGGCRDRDA